MAGRLAEKFQEKLGGERKSTAQEKPVQIPNSYVGFHEKMKELPRGSSVRQAIYAKGLKNLKTT